MFLLSKTYTFVSEKLKMWSTQVNNLLSKETSKENANKLPTFGMTSAISTASPKPSDITKTTELEESLKPFDVFESEQELNHRMVVLGKLYCLVKRWIKEVSIARNIPENVAENVGGKIYTFGSYRLGVSTTTLFLILFKSVAEHKCMCFVIWSVVTAIKTFCQFCLLLLHNLCTHSHLLDCTDSLLVIR